MVGIFLTYDKEFLAKEPLKIPTKKLANRNLSSFPTAPSARLGPAGGNAGGRRAGGVVGGDGGPAPAARHRAAVRGAGAEGAAGRCPANRRTDPPPLSGPWVTAGGASCVLRPSRWRHPS